MSSDVRETMDSQLYVEALDLESSWHPESGGQLLILADILACLKDCEVIAFPYPCPELEQWLEGIGKTVQRGISNPADAIYWGTPTVVDNKALFPDCLVASDSAEKWTKDFERFSSRNWTKYAEMYGLSVIVTGMGTGDISVKERLQDMGGGHVVSHKIFDGFEDWVLMRKL